MLEQVQRSDLARENFLFPKNPIGEVPQGLVCPNIPRFTKPDQFTHQTQSLRALRGIRMSFQECPEHPLLHSQQYISMGRIVCQTSGLRRIIRQVVQTVYYPRRPISGLVADPQIPASGSEYVLPFLRTNHGEIIFQILGKSVLAVRLTFIPDQPFRPMASCFTV